MMPDPNRPCETRYLNADSAGIAAAAALLAQGQTVAMPTETVYGLAADARLSDAVARIYAAKDRPSFNPLIVHVASVNQARGLAVFDAQAERLATQFWPGPLTLVLPLRPEAGLSDLVTAGLTTVGLRMPAHPVAQALLAAFGGPVAAPSANPSGRISPTSAQHVMQGLAGRVAAVLDGGICPVGVESTIVAPGQPTRLLRPGGIPVEALVACLGEPLAAPANTAIAAPGMMASHYAPAAQVRLNATQADPGEWHIGFGPVTGDETLSATGDLAEAATRLFATLHRADASGRPIAVAPIPDHGLGLAINDRLRRAAAPRE